MQEYRDLSIRCRISGRSVWLQPFVIETNDEIIGMAHNDDSPPEDGACTTRYA
jgi:hypothetical protein